MLPSVSYTLKYNGKHADEVRIDLDTIEYLVTTIQKLINLALAYSRSNHAPHQRESGIRLESKSKTQSTARTSSFMHLAVQATYKSENPTSSFQPLFTHPSYASFGLKNTITQYHRT